MTLMIAVGFQKAILSLSSHLSILSQATYFCLL